MKKSIKIAINALAIAALILMGGVARNVYQKYTSEQQHVKDLERQLSELSKKEKQTAVMQSINAQMEEIANQERIISEEQRREAVEQSKIANAMRQQAEKEQQNAHQAEMRAVEASEVAESQRAIAVKERSQAEYSKRVADTLSYLSMARNIASVATIQQNTGNKELASLLAYASYLFTQRFKGDFYHPSIYEALLQASEGQRRWAVAHGAITKTSFIPGTKSFMSISTYGEIMRHTLNGNLQTQTVYSNNAMDFRDIYIDKNRTFYAISHSGHLVASKENGGIHVVPINGAIRPFRIFHSHNELIITAERSVHIVDATTLRLIRILPLNFKTSVAGLKQNQVVLFDQAGNMYLLSKDFTKATKQPLPFSGRVMCYSANVKTGQQDFGMFDGTVIVLEANGKVNKLVGHNSRVSRLKQDNYRLFSSSYDGTVKFWNIGREKMEPINVLNAHRWIISMTFESTNKYILTTDQNGNLMETLIDVEEMAKHIKRKLKRNLTPQEWNYYIGKNVPYEAFIRKEARL
jgi:hypothetical protein